MTARSPGAFFVSILLHSMVARTVLLFSRAWSRQESPQVFELVAGPPGEDVGPEAPGGASLNLPESPPLPEYTPPEPEPEPEAIAPPTSEKVPPKKAEKTPPKPPPKPSLTYKEYVRKYGQRPPPRSTSTAPRSFPAPKVNTKGIAGPGTGANRNGQGGSSLAAAQGSALDAYFARLRAALKQNHEKPPGLSDLLAAEVEFLIAADGSISRTRVVRTSGDGEFDRSCLEAFKSLGTVGPRPDGKSDVRTVTFRMKEE